MKCTIDNTNLKTWNRVIHTLALTGDQDMFFCFTDSTVTLTAYGSSLEVCISCTFYRNFFVQFDVPRGADYTFRVPSKCILKPFRSMKFLTKSCTFCQIEFQKKKDTIAVTMGCKSGAEIRYTVELAADSETLEMDYDPDNLKNWIKTEPKIILTSLANFSHNKGLNDLTLEVKGSKVFFKNCMTDLVTNEGRIYTELVLNAVDFVEYNVQTNSELTFGLRELKNFASLAEHMKLPFCVHFQAPADPVAFTLKTEMFQSTMSLATKLFPDGQPEGTPSPAAANSNVRISNVSSEGRGAKNPNAEVDPNHQEAENPNVQVEADEGSKNPSAEAEAERNRKTAINADAEGEHQHRKGSTKPNAEMKADRNRKRAKNPNPELEEDQNRKWSKNPNAEVEADRNRKGSKNINGEVEADQNRNGSTNPNAEVDADQNCKGSKNSNVEVEVDSNHQTSTNAQAEAEVVRQDVVSDLNNVVSGIENFPQQTESSPRPVHDSSLGHVIPLESGFDEPIPLQSEEVEVMIVGPRRSKRNAKTTRRGEIEMLVENIPPRKRLRNLFPNLGKPFDVNQAFPGHDVVLAPESDEEDNVNI